MEKIYDISIIVGRFQPYHNGHEYLIKKGLELSKHTLLFIGNSGFTDYRHFISPENVSEIIKDSFNDANLHINTIYDSSNDSMWTLKLSMNVNTFISQNKLDKPNICFLGSKKDILWYSNLLPDWTLITVPSFNRIDATSIRGKYFCIGEISENVPEVTKKYLLDFKNTKEYTDISTKFKRYYGL